MTTLLPQNLLYQNRLESAYARSFTTHVQPQNGQNSYLAGQTIIINVPTSRNQVLVSSESVLKFDLQVTNNATASNYVRLDKAGAHGPFSRIRVYHGSSLLEDLDNYNNLVAQMTVLQKSSGCTGKDSVMQGFADESFCSVQGANTTTNSNQVVPIVAGERLIGSAGGSQFVEIPIDDVTTSYN